MFFGLSRVDIAEMGPIGAGAGDDVVAPGQKQRRVAILDRRGDLLDEVDQAALIGIGEAQQHRGDIGAAHGIGKTRHRRRIVHRRRQQAEARKRRSWSRSRIHRVVDDALFRQIGGIPYRTIRGRFASRGWDIALVRLTPPAIACNLLAIEFIPAL
jgi:hypothetical protein